MKLGSLAAVLGCLLAAGCAQQPAGSASRDIDGATIALADGPVRPGPKEHVTSETATFWPNHFDTAVTSMVGLLTRAGFVVIVPAGICAPLGTSWRNPQLQ